jgi:hypothetical protein
MVKEMYAVWIKIDETLPWIELNRTYQKREDAKRVAKCFEATLETKIINIPEKRRQTNHKRQSKQN